MFPTSPKGITKYYIGLGILMVFAIGCLVYAFSQAGSAKADRQTNKTVEQLSSKLDLSIANSGEIPESLQDAGITDPAPTVSYTKLDNTRYKVCIDYKSASNSFDAGWFSLLGGAVDSGMNQTDANKNTDYFDTTVEYSHKKGQNCQTVKPYGAGAGQMQPLNYNLGPSDNGDSGNSGFTDQNSNLQ